VTPLDSREDARMRRLPTSFEAAVSFRFTRSARFAHFGGFVRRSLRTRSARFSPFAAAAGLALVFGLSILSLSCAKTGEVSRKKAREHVELLAKAAQVDVEEIRKGLPLGAKQLEAFFSQGKAGEDAAAAKNALELARARVQDLRTAKSTFFLLADMQGSVLRSDQEHDALAGKNLFGAFPDLKAALGKYSETRGSMPEAAGVRGRSDGQWAAAIPVVKGSETIGVYATGWSWSAYAYRLENQLRSSVKSDAAANQTKEPLVYVYVVVEKEAYGAPISPDVIAKAITSGGLLGRVRSET
jgi:hypothetical protein